MNELTQVITVELTSIEKLTDEELNMIRTCSDRKERIQKALCELLECDNVNILNIQDFVREVDHDEN